MFIVVQTDLLMMKIRYTQTTIQEPGRNGDTEELVEVPEHIRVRRGTGTRQERRHGGARGGTGTHPCS